MGNNQSGFTLVELSIVLVIIGLVIGSVLVGQDLIYASSVRATLRQYQGFQTGVNSFRLKYNAIPGDLTQDQATALGFIPTERTYSTASWGFGLGGVTHGNGIVEGWYESEGAMFWQDLSSANMIDGSFSSVALDSNMSVMAATVEAVRQALPACRIGDHTFWMVQDQCEQYVKTSNCYLLQNWNGLTSGYMGTSYGISPNQAYSLDSKIDDGKPRTGHVLTTIPTYSYSCDDGNNTYLTADATKDSMWMTCTLTFGF